MFFVKPLSFASFAWNPKDFHRVFMKSPSVCTKSVGFDRYM